MPAVHKIRKTLRKNSTWSMVMEVLLAPYVIKDLVASSMIKCKKCRKPFLFSEKGHSTERKWPDEFGKYFQ